MHIKYKAEIEGWFRLTTRKAATGEISQDTGWFKNLITNMGMNKLASTSGIQGAAVGRGTNPELANDTQMQIFVAKSQTLQDGSQEPQVGSSVPPYYAKVYRVYRFTQGSVTGNINEVGALCEFGFNSNGSDAFLFSRTLIRDSMGSPVTLTVLEDEILDVAYECRVYPQDVPYEGTAQLMGNTHAFKVVPLNLDTAKVGNLLLGALTFSGGANEYYPSGTLTAAPYDISGSRDGFGVGPTQDAAYIPGSFKKFIRCVFTPGQGTGPIKAVKVCSSSSYEGSLDIGLEFTPAFTKAATVELKIVYEISWARRAI